MDTPSRIGRYEILEELGRGAMGMVYRAKDPAMDRVVAIKTIISVALKSDHESEFRERFYREARAAGGLAHPGIVPVFDVGEHEGVPFLVMEFISGRTLAEAIKKGERLTPERACEIGLRVAEALGYAHQRGVIHRDVKPANIMLTSKEAYGIERPKITDFGVAKLAEGRTTLTGQLLGTPAFMPPEQFTGGPIDGRADIFSLGVVLYWMATGEQAFPGESITAVSYKVVHTDPVPPRKLNPWLPSRLETVIMKCLAKSPDERYQTGEELAADLAKIREQGKVTAAKTTSAQEALAAPTAGSDPGLTMGSTAMSSAPTMAVQAPASAVPAQGQPQAKSQPKPTYKGVSMVVTAVVAVALLAGGWYVSRRHRAAVAAAASTTPPVTEKAVVPDESLAPVPAVSPEAAPASDQPAVSVVPAVESPSPKRSQAGADPSSASTKTKRKQEAKIEAKNAGPTPKAAAASPAPRASAALATPAVPQPPVLDFDPKTLDPKLNAKMRIDSKHMPAGVDYTVEMNGKLYQRKTSAGGDAPDDELFVPPGVQEFRVTVRSGAVQKSSNTVSTEFKAKKKLTLKIELRTQGAAPDSGIPQAVYQDTQVVLTLK
ncbi:MAG TPA: protein kinase [Terriglobales bacterium]